MDKYFHDYIRRNFRTPYCKLIQVIAKNTGFILKSSMQKEELV